jgi:hypothetical protein
VKRRDSTKSRATNGGQLSTPSAQVAYLNCAIRELITTASKFITETRNNESTNAHFFCDLFRVFVVSCFRDSSSREKMISRPISLLTFAIVMTMVRPLSWAKAITAGADAPVDRSGTLELRAV